MRQHSTTILAILTLVAAAACSEPAAEPPTAIEARDLVASASEWTPAVLTRDLQVDDATRQKIEADVKTLHASMLAMAARYEKAETLEGSARTAYMDGLDADIAKLHEQHEAFWEALDPGVRETLEARLHEQMHNPGVDGALKSFHERMRAMHGDDHGANGSQH